MNKDLTIEIDEGSGFCFGVTTAIKKAEEELTKAAETIGKVMKKALKKDKIEIRVEKLKNKKIASMMTLSEESLTTINHDEMSQLHGVKVLLRAHGEPPETYAMARNNGIEIIDATCPVVLALQRRIKRQYDTNPDAQIVIFGKRGHAEVLGLVGQTESRAIVVEKVDDVERLDFSRDIYLYSQTTKSLDGFHRVIDYIQQHIQPGATFKSFDTICRQVANRMPNIAAFASKHNLILFVSGRKSSNGKVLFKECHTVNPNSYQIESPEEIDKAWFTDDVHTVGICGATSTPKWLMEQCQQRILSF